MVRKFLRIAATFSLILMFAALVGVLYSGGAVHADAAYTYSGTLTDSNGVALPGATVTLTDASANTVSGTTLSDGSFSISAAPGTYLLSLSGSTSGSAASAFSLAQTGTPSIDLTSGGVIQNLVLPVATVNYTLYNAQGYQLTSGGYLNANGGSGTVSLYAGDPGETLSGVNYSVHSAGATGSFTSVVGAQYSAICDEDQNHANGGCNSLTVASGTNSVSVPVPASRKTFSGTLKTSTGGAINNATVALTDAYGNKVSGTTNSYGSFNLSVEPGMYKLSVNAYYGSNVPYGSSTTFSMSQTGAPTIDLTSGNVVQNLAIPMTQVSFYSTDLQRSPYSVTMNGTNSSVSLYAGDPGEAATVNSYVTVQSMYAQPTNYFTSIAGTVYAPNTICFNGLSGGGGNNECSPNSITIGAGSNYIDVPTVPGPTLTVSSPTSVPVLNWTDPAYVTSYIVYRDGVQVATTTGTSYTDNNVAPGTHTYSVVAVDSAGDTGGTTVTVNVVLSLPSLGTPTFSANPVVKGDSTVVTIAVGNQYGLLGGEYYIGSDPGQGNGIAMFYSNGVLMATVPAGSVTGDQILYFRAHNSAGWSATTYAVLHVVIATPTGLTATTPTTEPVLTWNSSPSASAYNVYRDGAQVGTSSSTSFTDNNVSSGTHSYYVVAVDSTGVTSGPSSSVGVTVVYAKPVLGSPEVSATSIVEGQSVTVTVDVEGNLYGVVGGEYYIGTDPGQGNGTAMTYSNGVLTATISGLSVGAQTISIRADNAAGWSDATATTVNVTNSTFSGTFTDSNGNAVAGATITLYNAAGQGVSTTTASDGSFSLAVLPGTYYLAVVDSNVDGMSVNMRQLGTSPSIVVTAGSNVTQNLILPVAVVNVVAYNVDGSLAAGGQVVADASGVSVSPVSLYVGDPGYYVAVATTASVNSQGQSSFNSLVGVTYGGSNWGDGICLGYTNVCNTTPFTVTSSTSAVAIPNMPAPALTVASPTAEPSLSWTAVAGAVSYDVYRDGSLVNTTSTTSFVDNNVSGGAHTYYVVAVDGLGVKSVPSVSANVTVNLIAPSLGSPSVSNSSITQGQTVTVTIPVSGNLYGLTGGEYYIGSTDPGQGHGIAMLYSNGVLTAVLSNLPAGTQTIHMRAKNSVGWSTVATASVNVVLPIFSGTLTDSNGIGLGGSIKISDAYGDNYTVSTGAGGSFSFSVKPGLYYISNISIYSLTLAQLSANASINLLTGNVTQNLILPAVTVNATLYNSQGYVNANGRLVISAVSGTVHLYAGDPGEAISMSTTTLNASSSGLVVFNSIVGTIYGTGSGHDGLCSYSQSTSPTTIYGCTSSYTVVSGTNTISVPQTPAPRNTFSGTLTDSDGVALVGVTVALKDSFGNTVSVSTGAGGSFSVSVEPGVYGLTVSSTGTPNVDSLGGFTVQQITAGIDLTAGNIAQNLVLPVSTMNITLYNAQGYAASGSFNTRGGSGVVSLYAGDAGELVTMTNSTLTGPTTFKTILGITYNGLVGAYTSSVLGPDGAIWFGYGGAIESVTTAGSFSVHPISATYTNPGQMTVAGGAVWYVESKTGATNYYIGKMTPDGTTTDYYMGGRTIAYLATGPDGNVWFDSGACIGRLDITTGAITCYAASGVSYSGATGIFTFGSDGNLYYYVQEGSSGNMLLLRLNPATGVTTTARNFGSYSHTSSITSGPDGNLYGTDWFNYNIWSVTIASGGGSYYDRSGQYTYTNQGNIISGPDGNLWFTDTGSAGTNIVKMTTGGVITRYTLLAGVSASSLTVGSDGAIWFSAGAGRIGRITTSGVVTLYNMLNPAHDGLCYAGSCIVYTPVSGTNNVAVPGMPAPRNTFSGVLADQNGNAIAGVVVTLTDAYSNSVSVVTGSDGSFSVAVEPGMYRLSLNASNNTGTDDGLYNFSMSQSGAPSINLTAGNIVQNLTVQVATVNYAAYAGAYIATVGSASGVSLYSGDPGETLSNIGTVSQTAQYGFVTSSSTGSFRSIVGTVYTPGSQWVGTVLANGAICSHNQSFPNKNFACVASSFTVTGTGPYYVAIAAPAAPTGLHATSPTTLPTLGWNAVPGTIGYKVYRDGSLIGTTSTPTFVDSNVASGVHAYYVVAFDSTPDVGASSGTINVTVNAVAPTLGTASLGSGTVVSGQGTTVTVPVTGNLYGVTGGEYYISVDPGQGNGTALTYSNGQLTGTVTGTTPGNQTVYVRAQNGAGWGSAVSVALTVLPTAPTDLVASSPTAEPSLSWTAVAGATSYDIYRDDTKIDSSTTTSYLDATATDGTHVYYVKAVDGDGGVSDPSNSVSVVVSSIAGNVSYYTTNDGTTVTRQTAPVMTGDNTQTVNSDGGVTFAASNLTGTAESGLTLWTGKLSDLPAFTVTGTGDPFVVKLWFDAGGDGSFFQWDASGNLTSQNGDTTGQGPDPTSGSLTVGSGSSFYMADTSASYTLAELIAGDDTASGITGDTIVTVWIGVTANNGSAAATISSVGALES